MMYKKLKKTASIFLRREGGRTWAPRLLRRGLLLIDGIKEILESRRYFLRPGFSPKRHVPHFLGIGAQKAATTWLDSLLRQHPDLWLPRRRKEVHYFDHNFWKGSYWYLWHFRGGEDRLRGEITPAYSALIDLEPVRQLNPGFKVVFILRNPMERAWSMACMDLAKSKGLNVEEVSEAAFLRHVQSEGSRMRGQYTRAIERWRQTFGEDNVLIGFFEEVETAPVALLARVFAFLGVDPERMHWEEAT